MDASRITTRTIEANGLRFAVDEAGSGPDIALCLHGFPESRFSWRHQLPVLAELGWHAVAPDMRGYGGSDRPGGLAAYRMEHLVADTAGLFEAFGARRRLLVGHDWGAFVAWNVAIGRRLPLDGLVVMNVPHPTIFRRVLRRSWRQRVRSLYVAFFQIPRLPEWVLTRDAAAAVGRAFTGMAVDKSAFPDSVLDHYRDNAVKPGAMTAMLNYYRANLRGLAETGAGPPIDIPVLMVWGEEDTALGLELTEGYGPLVRDFTLRRLPGVSHWVQQEAPGRVNAVLAEWLAERGLTRAAG
ncbi:alpha/beta fold hydrolase [Methylobacterium planeticum]|uniref:Alpha/beta fold hydrolase n=1 Tax=Methylobacterium planeticum TaxID=2615211 RepID=A0A6N6MXG3_9HYPH|nr:alpha/beta fold hydrolase [Methylobacterium planeticum]KAB1074754.1 alpha/beta fold hydrolase [Methylobacterium planeticum]